MLFIICVEGEPRFELLDEQGDVVDTIKVGRYDLATIRQLLADLGLKRDESYTWEKKAAMVELEMAFKGELPPIMTGSEGKITEPLL